MIDLLPNKILDLIGQWLDNEDPKVATMVCKLLWNIFFPIYLVKVLYHSKGFQVIKFPNLIITFHIHHGKPTSLLFFGMDANTDTELSCLAYALVQFPARAFGSISLCFSHYTVSFGTNSMWKPCYSCLSHSRPVHWWYYATSIYPHGLELDQPDDRRQFKLYPPPTTSVWCISTSWRTYASLLPGHFHHFPVKDAIEYLP